jgi:hypothetical protein
MKIKLVYAVGILAVCLAIVSCKKLESEGSQMAGPLAFESIKLADAIPDDYGPLIGVTQNSQSPKWVGLWFQKSDKTITAVFVNIEQGKIYEKALTIPRK